MPVAWFPPPSDRSRCCDSCTTETSGQQVPLSTEECPQRGDELGPAPAASSPGPVYTPANSWRVSTRLATVSQNQSPKGS